jgi:hypothetical protein
LYPAFIELLHSSFTYIQLQLLLASSIKVDFLRPCHPNHKRSSPTAAPLFISPSRSFREICCSMSSLNVNTPDFVPCGPPSDASAPAAANPFLKLAAKEFVPSAPAFVPSGGFGSAFPTFVPSFTPAAPVFHPPSHLQQRSAVTKEGDDMSLSEVHLPIVLQFLLIALSLCAFRSLQLLFHIFLWRLLRARDIFRRKATMMRVKQVAVRCSLRLTKVKLRIS